jgi:CHAD domain-containing protein
MKLLPDVLNSERAEAVHDLRVWSRRLQQVLVTMFSTEQENRAAPLIRALRRARRGLSGWRDCDVLTALLDRRLRRLRNHDEELAWRVVGDYLAGKREKEIRRARRRLANRTLFTLGQRTEHLLKERELDTEPYADFMTTVSEFIKAAHVDWRTALAHATESDSQADAHNFRIKTKQLRYRIELARDLGNKELSTPLNWLKWLQDSLGQWHDRAELARIAIEAIAQAEFLLTAPRAASLLLRRLARERLSDAAMVRSLLVAVKDAGELAQLEGWVANHSGEVAPLHATRTSES